MKRRDFNCTTVDPGRQEIVQIGADLYRINVKRKRLLDFFSSLADVTVMEDGRVIFPGWMLPAVKSLYARRRPSVRFKTVQMGLWEER